jgi:hypothetical protein
MVVLDLLWDSLPELGAGLDKGESWGNGKVGNGWCIRKDELGVLEEAVDQNLEVGVLQLLELLLGECTVGNFVRHSKDNVSDCREAIESLMKTVRMRHVTRHTVIHTDYSPWIHRSLTPVESKINLSSLEWVGWIQLVALLRRVAKVSHDSRGFPNGLSVIELHSWGTVTRIHGDKLRFTGLSIAVDQLAVDFQLANDSEGAMGVGGLEREEGGSSETHSRHIKIGSIKRQLTRRQIV